MKPKQHLLLKINLKLQLSTEDSAPTGEASPDQGEAPVTVNRPSPTEVMDEEVDEVEEEIGEEQELSLPEGQDTHPTHQNSAVTATTSTERTRGTVWHHSPAPG